MSKAYLNLDTKVSLKYIFEVQIMFYSDLFEKADENWILSVEADETSKLQKTELITSFGIER